MKANERERQLRKIERHLPRLSSGDAAECLKALDRIHEALDALEVLVLLGKPGVEFCDLCLSRPSVLRDGEREFLESIRAMLVEEPDATLSPRQARWLYDIANRSRPCTGETGPSPLLH